MIKTEDCYIILDPNESVPAEEYLDCLFESVVEAETYIEKNGDDPDNYEIISLLEYFEE